MHRFRLIPAGDAIDQRLANELLSLQHRAYSVESALIGDSRIPQLGETQQDLAHAPVRWLIATAERGQVIGAIAWSSTPDCVEIDRLIVEPALHRTGIGRQLLERALAAVPVLPVVVATGARNTPARALYESLDFTYVGDVEVEKGLSVSRYRLGTGGY